MKNIIITGAGHGIGRATVLKFMSMTDYKVVAISRSADRLAPFQTPDNRLLIVSFDLEEFQNEGNDLYNLIGQEMGHVDILINNAGLLINKPFASMSLDDARRMFEVNTLAPGRLIKLLLPLMGSERGTHIVNISSMGGFQGSEKFPGLHYYSASKGALAILTECLAEELNPMNIAVNCLALGAVQTEMMEKAFPGYKAPLSADEMAEFLADFAISGSRFFNGKILPVSVSVP